MSYSELSGCFKNGWVEDRTANLNTVRVKKGVPGNFPVHLCHQSELWVIGGTVALSVNQLNSTDIAFTVESQGLNFGYSKVVADLFSPD
jgi:hypothetical protein